jgi:hypothetical protein
VIVIFLCISHSGYTSYLYHFISTYRPSAHAAAAQCGKLPAIVDHTPDDDPNPRAAQRLHSTAAARPRAVLRRQRGSPSDSLGDEDGCRYAQPAVQPADHRQVNGRLRFNTA